MNAYYAGSRQRAGRKKRKKNKDHPQQIQHDWDDIYDPSRPNNYEEYKHSDEKIREVREWKDLLYRHRMKSKRTSTYDSDSDRSVDVKRNRKLVIPHLANILTAQINSHHLHPCPLHLQQSLPTPIHHLQTTNHTCHRLLAMCPTMQVERMLLHGGCA